MKPLILTICFAFSINAWSLGKNDSLPKDHEKITNSIKTSLEVSDDDAFRVYEDFLKVHLNSEKWQYNIYDNNTINSSKVGTSQNKTVLVNFVTNDRYVNIMFTKYKKEKQLLVQTIETIPLTSKQVLDKYKSLKNDSNWEINFDEPELSTFTKKGFAKQVKMLVDSNTGGVQYIDFFTFKLNK